VSIDFRLTLRYETVNSTDFICNESMNRIFRAKTKDVNLNVCQCSSFRINCGLHLGLGVSKCLLSPKRCQSKKIDIPKHQLVDLRPKFQNIVLNKRGRFNAKIL